MNPNEGQEHGAGSEDLQRAHHGASDRSPPPAASLSPSRSYCALLPTRWHLHRRHDPQDGRLRHRHGEHVDQRAVGRAAVGARRSVSPRTSAQDRSRAEATPTSSGPEAGGRQSAARRIHPRRPAGFLNCKTQESGGLSEGLVDPLPKRGCERSGQRWRTGRHRPPASSSRCRIRIARVRTSASSSWERQSRGISCD